MLDRLNGSKGWFDAGAIGILGLNFADLLPDIATGLTIVWTLLRVWEMKTTQRLFRRLKAWFVA